jgi:hypothetical protein
LRFNKIIKKQIAQLATAIPIAELGKTLGKPETSLKSINMVLMRSGKPQHRKSHENLVDPAFVAKEDPGRPTIKCSVSPHVFHNTFCDLGAIINVMSKVTHDKILGGLLSTANFRLQMADQSS